MAIKKVHDCQGVHPVIRSAGDITAENVHQVVPTCKFDLNRVEFLHEVDPQIWIPIIPDLIDWTCDPCWPSSQFILSLLKSNPIATAASIPYISTILRKTEAERDDEHQNCLLLLFVSEVDVSFQREMIVVLREFRDGVTDELDADWNFRETVDGILEGMTCDGVSQKSADTAHKQ